jgi:hypothetical protein
MRDKALGSWAGRIGEAAMFETMRKFMRRDVAAEVPDELALCMECDSVDCLEEKFINCPNRLARAAELRRLRTTDADPTTTYRAMILA